MTPDVVEAIEAIRQSADELSSSMSALLATLNEMLEREKKRDHWSMSVELKLLRKDRGDSLRVLAGKSGLPYRRIWEIEHGADAHEHEIKALAHALGLGAKR